MQDGKKFRGGKIFINLPEAIGPIPPGKGPGSAKEKCQTGKDRNGKDLARTGKQENPVKGNRGI